MFKRVLPQIGLVALTAIVVMIFQPFSHIQSFAQSGCQDFKETGKKVCGKFLTYWQQNGGLRQQGFPISNEFQEKSDLNGQTYTVQYFERAVFEMHPENPAPNDVLLSQLGTFWGRQKYGNPPQFPGAPVATPVPSAPPGIGFKYALPRESVTIALVDQFNGYSTGIHSDGCGTYIDWIFKIENTSKAPFTMSVEQNSIAMTDNTGQKYPLRQSCGGGINPAIAQATTVGPGTAAQGAISFSLDKVPVPANATYLDLKLTVSGVPITYRYSLK